MGDFSRCVYVCKYSQVAGYLADCVKWARTGQELYDGL